LIHRDSGVLASVQAEDRGLHHGRQLKDDLRAELVPLADDLAAPAFSFALCAA
jgi:hypothetical protein